MPINPVFLVLAAGQSKRFGSAKLGVRMANGRTIIENTLRAIKSTGHNICVVVSQNSEAAISAATQLAIPFCQYPGESPGMGDSLRFGVQHTATSDGWIICLADMPFIPPHIYQQVGELAQSHSLIVPAFKGKAGHPVYFHARYKQELLELAGDAGGKSLLRRHADSLWVWECDEPAVLLDIDVPADLASTHNPSL